MVTIENSVGAGAAAEVDDCARHDVARGVCRALRWPGVDQLWRKVRTPNQRNVRTTTLLSPFSNDVRFFKERYSIAFRSKKVNGGLVLYGGVGNRQ